MDSLKGLLKDLEKELAGYREKRQELSTKINKEKNEIEAIEKVVDKVADWKPRSRGDMRRPEKMLHRLEVDVRNDEAALKVVESEISNIVKDIATTKEAISAITPLQEKPKKAEA